jgi:hypothetical protein
MEGRIHRRLAYFNNDQLHALYLPDVETTLVNMISINGIFGHSIALSEQDGQTARC